MKKTLIAPFALLFASVALAQQPRIPASYSNLAYDAN